MELERAIALLRAEYNWAKQQSWIKNPLAYALYLVWKDTDKRKR